MTSRSQFPTHVTKAVPQFINHSSRDRKLLPFLTALAVILAMAGLSSCSGYTTNSALFGGTGPGAGNGSTGNAGVLSANSTSVAFGNVAVGSTATQSVTVTNSGTATVNLSAATISGAGFTVMGGNPSASIPVGQSITVQMQFAPTAPGAANGTLTVTSDASNSPLAVSLSGTGMQPGLTISPSSLDFSNVTVGQTSSQNVTLINGGNARLTVNLATVSGAGFGISGLALPKTMAAGANLSFSVSFTPTSTAGETGSIVFTDNASNSPQTLTLTGGAVATGSTLSANPGSFNFNSVAVNSSSQQTFTLTNSGNTTITINQVSTTGAGFSGTGLNAGQKIAAGATATLVSTFAPTTTGAASGSVTITSTATNPTLTIPLSGTGTQGALSASPASINFGAVLEGASASVPVTLTNTGSAPVSITNHSIAGTGFTLAGWSAPATLTPGQTTSFTVTFAPAAAGSASGKVSITDNAPGSPLAIGLSGSGTNIQATLTISPSPVAFNSVNVGSNSTQFVTLTNTGNTALKVTAATISGLGFSTTLTPRTINAGAISHFSVTFAPTGSGSASGSIQITSNAPGSPATIPLSATGVQAQVSASPTSVAFSNVAVGSSDSQPIKLTNNGNALLSFSNISVAGAGMSINGLTTSSTIAAGGSLIFNAMFAPAGAGAINGTILLATNGTPSPMTINLSGTGVASALTLIANPTSLNFGTVNLNASSSLPFTLTNTGNSNVMISGLTTTGAGFGASGVSNGTILTPGQTATVTVTFNPTTAGAVSGASVKVASNASGSPTTVALSGTGQAATAHSVQLSWDASPTAGVSGYNVFRAGVSDGYGTTPLNPAPISTLSFTDTTVASGQTYFYVVTAVDAGEASSDSNEVSVSVP
jgi:centrosomal CEP192-like protein/HYDIN/CFA65/VesB family protein/ASPM-SPD-2-Hydin domain-containing protein/uncharacterized protein DUF1573